MSKILLGGGLLMFVDLFLPWNRVCFGGECGQFLGWHGGLGVLLGLLVLALLAWEGARAANVNVPIGTLRPELVSAGLAALVALFALLRSLIKPSVIFFGGLDQFAFAWIGLVIGLVIGLGGYMAFQEASASRPPSPTDTSGSAT